MFINVVYTYVYMYIHDFLVCVLFINDKKVRIRLPVQVQEFTESGTFEGSGHRAFFERPEHGSKERDFRL